MVRNFYNAGWTLFSIFSGTMAWYTFFRHNLRRWFASTLHVSYSFYFNGIWFRSDDRFMVSV